MNSIQSEHLPGRAPDTARAFTLIELVVVLAVLALLLVTLAPALARTRPTAHRFQCLNNLNQIQNAIVIYAHDYRDLFPPNPDDPGNDTPGHHWVSNVDQQSPFAYDPAPLLDPTHSLVTTYLSGNIKLFKCPADTRQGPYQAVGAINPSLAGKVLPAARSISMSEAVGSVCPQYKTCSGGHGGAPRPPTNGPWLDGNHANGCPTLVWSTFGQTTSFRKMSPAMVFILCDENSYSINDGSLATSAVPQGGPGGTARLIDYPACWHNGGAGFAFCDGHAEIHKWLGTAIQISPSTGYTQPSSPLDWIDYSWLAQHSSTLDH